MPIRPTLLICSLVSLALAATACSDDDPLADSGADLTAADASPDSKTSPDSETSPDSKTSPEAGPDAATEDGKVGSDAIPYFPKILDGIWLVGWSGGLRHYSWIRLTVKSAASGSATLLDGKSLPSNTPLWNCNGTLNWNITAKPRTVQLQWTGSTCTGHRSDSYTFANFKQPGSVPKGAILRADVSGTYPSGQSLEAFKFPASQCDATMTTCKNPF